MIKSSHLSRIIYRNTIFVALLALLLATVSSIVVEYQSYNKEVEDSLVHGLKTLAISVNTNGDEVLKAYDLSDRRVTLIAADGTVLFDSEVSAEELENHLDREEVQEALLYGEGISTRRSDTLDETTVNAAVKLDNGEVLRISRTRNSLFSIMERIGLPMLLVSAILVLLTVFLSMRVADFIMRPINNIDLAHPDDINIYKEMQPLVDHINDQNAKIANQFQELQNYHKEEDRIRSEFTANVSHELKTPLTSISGYAELIETGIAKPEDVPRFAGIIHDESQRLIVLVGDIIKLSQLDDTDVPVKYEDVDLYKTCEDVLSHLQHVADKNNITLSLSGEHIVFHTVEDVVEELVFNLCDNAVKYNKTGGRVDVSVHQCVDGIELTVADTGIGIPEEDRSRIFERFYRVDKSHSKEIGGTGLGLSIVKHAVAYLKARISVDSTVGSGTTIRVLF